MKLISKSYNSPAEKKEVLKKLETQYGKITKELILTSKSHCNIDCKTEVLHKFMAGEGEKSPNAIYLIDNAEYYEDDFLRKLLKKFHVGAKIIFLYSKQNLKENNILLKVIEDLDSEIDYFNTELIG